MKTFLRPINIMIINWETSGIEEKIHRDYQELELAWNHEILNP
jgi:hypothetical protein